MRSFGVITGVRIILLLIFLMSAGGAVAQYDFSEKKERHKIWKKSGKRKRQSYNPYLDRKRKDKPSVKMARDNKKEMKRQNRAAKKQMRKSRRQIGKANRRRLKGKG